MAGRRFILRRSKAGFSRFKARDRFDSIEFPSYGDGIKLKDFKLKIQHVGEVPIILHRPIGGLIKAVTVKNEADKWFQKSAAAGNETAIARLAREDAATAAQ